MSDIAIKVEHVSKSFKLPHSKANSIKSKLISLKDRERGYEIQQALKDISFEVKKGEFFGIVGRNGSGKSTLLKLISGIYTQDSGNIQVNGKLTPFIELGVGFNPELSGRDNVFLNGALLGFNRQEMDEMYDEIVEFAELERFMDQKLKNYSSGMQVRLAFSIAIRANTDILVLDEVLAVGDAAFQRKCYQYFAELKKNNKTVILVTHDMGSVRRFCSRALLVNDSKVHAYGKTETIASKYETLNRPSNDTDKQGSLRKKNVTQKNQDINVSVSIKNKSGESVENIFPEDKITLVVNIKSKITLKDVFLGVIIKDAEGRQLFWLTTEKPNTEIGRIISGEQKVVTLELQNIFGDNEYSIDLSIRSNDRTTDYFLAQDIANFSVSGWGMNGWMFHPKYNIKIGDI